MIGLIVGLGLMYVHNKNQETERENAATIGAQIRFRPQKSYQDIAIEYGTTVKYVEQVAKKLKRDTGFSRT